MNKNKMSAKREASMEAVAQLQREAARHRDARTESSPDWDCTRGHAWDDNIGVAQNVRCMNCAAQRREMRMARLEALAEERGGRLMSASSGSSASPLDAAAALRWQCAFGHEWQARADVASRRWCEQCVRCGVYDDTFPHQASEFEREAQAQSEEAQAQEAQPITQRAGDGR